MQDTSLYKYHTWTVNIRKMKIREKEMELTIRELRTDLIDEGEKFLEEIDTCSNDPLRTNEDLLLQILHDNRNTEYGRKYGFGGIRSADEYRKKVPLSNYDDYASYIERMIKKGEHNLITAYNVVQYAVTSGSVGVQKIIPMTEQSMSVYEESFFARTTALASRYYMQKYGHTLPVGKCLNMLETESYTAEDSTPKGSVSGAVSGRFRDIFPLLMISPEPVQIPRSNMNMNYMKARFALEDSGITFILSAFMTNIVDMMNYIRSNWEMITDDIEKGTINENVCDEVSRALIMPYIRKRPKRAQELRDVFSQGFDTPIIPRIWKKLTWVCSIGTGSFATYTEKFRKYAGSSIAIDHFAYAASEGMFATTVKMNDTRFAPLLKSCFFEFLPADAPEGSNDTLFLDELEDGKDYEIIITNLSGFYRYRIKDVIRVVGFYNNCPMITFAYRKSQLVNVAAEKMTEEHMDEAVRRMKKELNCEFNDYAIYVDSEGAVSRYVVLLEPDHPIPVDAEGIYGEIMGRLFGEVNPEYGILTKLGSLGRPLVLIQQPQTHALWRDLMLMKGVSRNQIKPVRVLDTPMKQRFFFELLEEGQPLPKLPFSKQK